MPIQVCKNISKMKKDIHPGNYRLVVFKDMSNGFTFMTRSTAPSKETIKMDDGKEYPLVKLEISDTSHPFYTGKMKLVDTAGRVDKFMSRYKDHLEKKKNKTSK
jgi:large subunit ribosomal protein L31